MEMEAGSTAGHTAEFAVRERVPTRWSAVIFRVKATLLQARRAARDVAQGVTRYPPGDISQFPHIIAESRTSLWSEASPAERDLQRGKVQNLRCALRRLDGIEIPAGGLFSFWKQIGRATRRGGYVPGRLLREGCLMPAVGGGLCQLSNALYDVALQSDFEIVERWGHSRIVPGSSAATGRDATVAWNYIDLRFRPLQAVLIEARLTADELVLRVRARQPKRVPQSPPLISFSSLIAPRPKLDPQAHSCATCGQSSCFRHAPSLNVTQGSTAWLMDECWPEFREYSTRRHEGNDVLGIPLDGHKWKYWGMDTPRYDWDTSSYARIGAAALPTLLRSWRTRRLGRYGAARLQAQIADARTLADALSSVLSPDVTHIVAAQSLLPFLWRAGHLGGRRFDVLMTRLPLAVLHERLDTAFQEHPERRTLAEFRAPQWLLKAETEALAAATRVITPHAEIARLFSQRVLPLDWHLPPSSACAKTRSRVVAFPGPTAARKGAYELREAARALDLEIALCGAELEGDNFWHGIKTRRADSSNWLDGVEAVVQPALIEDNPRRLLSAIAAGVPVVATPECGLGNRAGVITVRWSDVEALKKALSEILAEEKVNARAIALLGTREQMR